MTQRFVGIEELVGVDVLEGGFIGGGALGGFAEDELAGLGVGAEVAALAIGGGAAGYFHEERGVGSGEVGEEFRVEGGAEVVAVGDERVADAGCEEGVEFAGAGEGDIEVAVAWRAPFVVGVFGVFDGKVGGGVDFWDFVLDEFEIGRVAEFGVFSKCGEGVGAGAEGVHEEDLWGGALGAEVEDLFGDEIEEGQAGFDFEEGFGFFEAHACAEAAVEFDEDG